MITLYQFHWSHFVEKIRWALDFKRLEWSAVDVDPFTKRQLRQLPSASSPKSASRSYVPVIHDDATGAVVADSSAILRYLESTYPAPTLYPTKQSERQELDRWLLWLDSAVGLATRRLGYTQIMLERPSYLTELFIPKRTDANGSMFATRTAGMTIAGLLTRRFRLLHNRADRVFETLEQCLLLAARHLHSRPFLVGDSFTAVDLTLASLLRPITVVPFFHDHPQLAVLFAWRRELLQAHRRELEVGYETALHEVRTRRGWSLGAVSWLPASMRSSDSSLLDIPTLQATYNDQQPVGRSDVLFGPFWFVCLQLTSGLRRQEYRSDAHSRGVQNISR
jgi:glutathione S-transferase